jgi:hypothetical protein
MAGTVHVIGDALLILAQPSAWPFDFQKHHAAVGVRKIRTAAAPSMRTLVRWAQKCDSAEQLGERLRRRCQRQQQRQGIASHGRSRAEGEIAEQLDRLLAQDCRALVWRPNPNHWRAITRLDAAVEVAHQRRLIARRGSTSIN